jgi:hypothetical protein
MGIIEHYTPQPDGSMRVEVETVQDSDSRIKRQERRARFENLTRGEISFNELSEAVSDLIEELGLCSE